MLPSSRPRLSKEDALKILKAKNVSLKNYKVVLLGIRGYYLDSMGKEGTNDRRIYDDAAFWITNEVFESFNFNTDPNGYRPGDGHGNGKGMAVLKPGNWLYQKGLHKGYAAFRQGQAVIVMRDKTGGGYYEHSGWFGINIHRGGNSSTSSLGCQTLPTSQWNEFKALGYQLITKENVSNFCYCLVTEEDCRKILSKEVGENGGEVIRDSEKEEEKDVTDIPLLRRGDRGRPVYQLQAVLNSWIVSMPEAQVYPLVIDGDFGPKTEIIVKRFQRSNNLLIDGVVGPATRNVLLGIGKPV